MSPQPARQQSVVFTKQIVGTRVRSSFISFDGRRVCQPYSNFHLPVYRRFPLSISYGMITWKLLMDLSRSID